MGTATYCWGVKHPIQRGVAILLGMLHANESGLSSGRLGLWLMCAFTFMPYIVSQQNRARNNGRSTDNVPTDWGVDQSTFRLAGHVDRSQSIVLKTIVISIWRVAVHCETLI